MSHLKEILTAHNPWWRGEAVPHLPPRPRRVLAGLLEGLGQWPHRAHLLVGPRRVGKTTLLLHAIQRLLEAGVPADNLLLLPGERLRQGTLPEALAAHRELAAPTGTVYCFLDEGHWLPDWSVEVKVLVDLRADCRFVVTGSSSTLLFHQTAEALVGRVHFHSLLPMTFGEWLALRGRGLDPPQLAGGFAALEALFEPPMLAQALAVQARAAEELPRYLLWGGLPEQLELELPLDNWHRNLEEAVLGVALLRDVISRFSVRDPTRLELLVRLLAEKSGWPLSATGLARTLQLKADTVRSYLTFLEHARLLLPCPLFTRNLPKQVRRNAKYYLMDSGLLCALRGARQLDGQHYGPALEQAVALHLHNLELNSGRPLATGLRYWSYKQEVDFVLQLRGVGPASLLPVEVKARGTISGKDLKGMAEFMALQDCPAGVVVTRDLFEKRELEGRPVYLIPAAVFLLLAEPHTH